MELRQCSGSKKLSTLEGRFQLMAVCRGPYSHVMLEYLSLMDSLVG